jgi:predicted  nucleic acid-binding Zn-ribbon protein
MGDTATLFRLVAACGLVGLLAYCTGYVVQIWRKRNAKPSQNPVGASPARKLAWMGLIMGFVLVFAAGVLRELTRSEGQLSGEDLFVVRASDDMVVEWIQDRDTVSAGEPLVRFGSGSRTARADELRARLAHAEAERDMLALMPLAPDPELTRRHQSAAQERAQVQQELGQAIAAAESADRDLNSQLQTKKETLARLQRTLTERRRDLDRATIRLRHNRELAESYARLRATRTISEIEYQELQKATRDAEVEVASLTQELKDGQAEKDLLQAHLAKLESGRADPKAPLQAQVATLKDRLTQLQTQEKGLREKLDGDLARSSDLRKAEMAQAAAKVHEQQAGVEGLAGEQEIRAPFGGRIAYRSASPNAARQRGALMVLSPDSGFRLTARLPRSEVSALRDGSEVTLDVGDDSPERRIPARFRKAESLPHEPDQAALQLDCEPPPEVVRRLADGEKMTVVFGWHPPLTGMWSFQAGIILVAIGLGGLFWTRPRLAAPVKTLAHWSGPIPESAFAVTGIFSRFRDLIQKGQIETEMLVGVTGGQQHALTNDSCAKNEFDAPELLDELEEFYRDSLDRLNRAECPEEAAKLLERLHHLRSTIRILEPSEASALSDHRSEGNRAVMGARP